MYELTTMALWESSQDPARRSEGLLRVHPWVSLGFSRGLREERAHEWTKGLATARRACKLALLVLPNRQGESHRTLAFVAVVFVHGHRGSSDSPAPRSVTRTKPSKKYRFQESWKESMRRGHLLDHLIGPCQQRLRDRQAQRLGRLQIDDQRELGRLLDWYISRFGTLQNLVDEDRGTSPVVKKIRGIGHEASSLDKEAIFIHGGEPVLD